MPIPLPLAFGILSLSLLASAASGADEPAGARPAACDGAALTDIRKSLDTHAAAGESGIVLVECGGNIVLHHPYGFADRAKTRRVDENTAFNLASIAKPITVSAMLLLEHRGKLSLDDPISKYIPEANGPFGAAPLKSLLLHTSGMTGRYVVDDITDADEAVRAIVNAPRDLAPGEKFHYTGLGAILSALIIERVSGRNFAAFTHEELFQRAGMTHSWWYEDVLSGKAKNVAELPDADHAPPNRPTWGFRGGSGFYSSAGDLYKWVRALRSGEFVSKQATDTMFAMHVPIREGITHGMGWFYDTRDDLPPRWWTGGNESFGCSGVIYDFRENDLLVIVVTHAMFDETPTAKVIGKDIARRLLAP